ncbi:leucine-rich repeat protein [Skeletonema marinoi]|uniref:Leucine-rich repeat protein n=1 Tax=Skeletonema marinoi TaxID=267567 RepID=A0AAD9D540_9STRA|nr:leucine-rich repeat protein [Skeletonema marinoi]
MENRDDNFYEANAADVNLEEITSSAKNAKILQQLRDGDPKLHCLILGGLFSNFHVSEDDDLGWLGFFISRSACLHSLNICYLPDGEQQIRNAFSEGIARSQSIRNISIDNLNNDAFTAVMRVLRSLSQLEGLTIWGDNNIDHDGWYELRILLESGGCKLKQLCLSENNYIRNEGLDVLSNGLRGIGSSLKVLTLSDNSISNEGLSTLVEALQTCTSLERLHLSSNDFSSAAAGLSSLSDWLWNAPMNLKNLGIECCSINDDGLHAVVEGAAIHCKELYLDGNGSITSAGLSYLSNAIRSDSCRVETLWLQGIPIGDDGTEVLARGLANNKSVRSMYLGDSVDVSVTSAGWLAFSTALCDTSSVNNTYLSNHTICDIWNEDDEDRPIPPQYISLHLQLNGEHPQYAARCKILMSHPHLIMEPLHQWGLKSLPLAVAWFERAKPCTALTIEDAYSDLRRRILDESDEAFESRELTAMYEFVRGMPMEVMKSRSGLAVAVAYDEKIARIEEENKIALEQRDRKNLELEEEIARLQIENKRLSGIVEAVRKNVGF